MDIVASSITFVSSILSAYRAIDRLNQLPREFQEVEQRLPLVRDTLATIKNQLDSGTIEKPTESLILRSVAQCDEYGRQLKSIFDAIGAYDRPEKSALVRYKNTVVSKGKQLGKAHRVEVLMTGMLKCVKDLAENRVFHTATHAQVAELTSAIDALSHVKSSIPDAEFDRMSTSTTQHIASGGSGNQGHQFGDGTLYNIGGNNNNTAGGPMFNAHVGAVNFVNSGPDESRSKVMKSLVPIFYLEAKNQNDERLEGTCEWFTEHPKFKQWDASRTSSMLYVSADPGCGKSVLARYLVDSVLPNSRGRIVCYFFFKENIEQQSLAVSALRCILHQIFSADGNLLSPDLLKRFKHSQQVLTSVDDLWSILLKVVQDAGCGEVVCIVDALDECAEQGRKSLQSCLRIFYGQHREGVHLKFLATSRPYAHIRRGLLPRTAENSDVSVIHLKGDNQDEVDKISREISIVVEARAQRLRKNHSMTDDEFACLLKELQKVPNRTYLWAHLAVDWLDNQDGFCMSDIRTLSLRLPKTVNDAYEAILSRSNRPRDEIFKLLHIVVASERPLTLDEMDVALAIESHHKSYNKLDLRGKRIGEYVRELCGLFVTIIDSKIYLLHQTAKEFLVQNSATPIHFGTWKYSLQPQESHRVLFHICARVLLLEECRQSPSDKRRLFVDWSLFSKSRPMFGYSTVSWAYHYRFSGASESAILAALFDIDLDGCPRKCYAPPTWFKYYDHTSDETGIRKRRPITALGLSSFLSDLRQQNGCREVLESTFDLCANSPLHIAAAIGYADVLRVLISHFDGESRSKLVNQEGHRGKTSLMWATENNHLECMKILLKAGAAVHERDSDGLTALFYFRDQQAAKLLMDYGACVGDLTSAIYKVKPLQCEYYMELFGREVFVEYISPFFFGMDIRLDHNLIRTLLSDGFDANTRNNDGSTALVHACKIHDIEVAVILIEHEADIGLPDSQGYKPLWYCNTAYQAPVVKAIVDAAAWRGSSDANWLLNLLSTKRLYQYSATEIQSLEDVKYALSAYASLYDDIDFAKFLHGTEIMAYSHTGSRITDLQWAILSKSSKVTAYLLDRSNGVESLGDGRETALHWAVLANSHALIRDLLCRGVDINTSSRLGTPLAYAVLLHMYNRFAIGHLFRHELFPQLSDIRDVNSETRAEDSDCVHKSNMLMTLTKDSSAIMATIKLMLSKGADTNAFDHRHRTPLFHASTPEVVQLLVDKGADVEARDIDGSTPLMNATKLGVVEALLQKGADVNADNIWGQTALMLAIQREMSAKGWWGPIDIAECLILNGACVSDIRLSSRNSDDMKELIQEWQSQDPRSGQPPRLLS